MPVSLRTYLFRLLTFGALTSIMVLLNPTHACGPLEVGFRGYAFLKPDLIGQMDRFSPYFLQFEDLYRNEQRGQIEQIRGNLEEWRERFCEQASLAEFQQIIYKTELSDLQLLRTAIASPNIPIDFKLAKNKLARHLKRHQCTEFINYLIYAKTCEPHVTGGDGWDTPARDTNRMQNLLDVGLRNFQKTESNYIRLRYIYQIVRLAHYAKNYTQTVSLYDRLMPMVDTEESMLTWWILGHKAGALLRLDRPVEAAYQFLLVFKNCPSKRESAFRSFRVRTDEQWDQVYLRCATDEERATLFALRAQRQDSRAVTEMRSIYELDPRNPHLEPLLIRELRKLERDLLGLEFNDHREENKRNYQLPRQQAGLYLVQLDSFVRQVVGDKQVEHPNVWLMANGYLEFLGGDLYAASKTFERAAETITNDTLHSQLDIFRLALEINSIEEMDEDSEQEVYEILTDNEVFRSHPDFPDFLNDRVGYLYAQADQPGRSFRFHYDFDQLKFNPQLDVVEDLLEVVRKPEDERNRLEDLMIKDEDGLPIREDLLIMKGMSLFNNGKPEAALETFKRVDRDRWNDTRANPFFVRYDECIECPLPDSITMYNRVELIERIFELEYKARADYQRGAQYYFRLGVAHYNLSYFGHSWRMMDYFRSGTNWHYAKLNIYDHYWAPFGNHENTDVSQALFYFEKVLELVKDDYELAAKAAFMAARCQQKMYFVSVDTDYNIYQNKMPPLPAEYLTYYRMLHDYYSETNFYQEAIRECKYLSYYR